MILLVRKWMLLLFLLPISALAQDQNLWAYGCDHFLYGACFRVPNDIAVTHTIKADFGLHTFMHGKQSVLTAYEGDAPSRAPSDPTKSLELRADGYHLRGFIEDRPGSSRYIVFVDSDRKGDMKIHLTGETNGPDDRAILAAILGGFRVCRFKQTRNDQILACPRRSDWGQRVAAWVMGATADASTAGTPQEPGAR